MSGKSKLLRIISPSSLSPSPLLTPAANPYPSLYPNADPPSVQYRYLRQRFRAHVQEQKIAGNDVVSTLRRMKVFTAADVFHWILEDEDMKEKAPLVVQQAKVGIVWMGGTAPAEGDNSMIKLHKNDQRSRYKAQHFTNRLTVALSKDELTMEQLVEIRLKWWLKKRRRNKGTEKRKTYKRKKKAEGPVISDRITSKPPGKEKEKETEKDFVPPKLRAQREKKKKK
jgi:hypothetical protein